MKAFPSVAFSSFVNWPKAIIVAIGTFLALGTAAALWLNPFFIRMTPTSGFEILLLMVQSLIIGVFFGVRRSHCAAGRATAGTVLSFVGVACPICNKVLVFAFGTGLLLSYFEPVRLYVGLAGVILSFLALLQRFSQCQRLFSR